jgi:hypothetical protein
MDKLARHLHSSLLIASAVLVFTVLACSISPKTTEPAEISTATLERASTFSSNTNGSGAPTDTYIPATPNETPVAETYLGDAIQESGYAITALNMADPATPNFNWTAKAGMKLVAIDVVISNISGDSWFASPFDVYLLDSNNLTYKSEVDAVDDTIDSVTLNPGEQVKGWISYTIPDTATPAYLQYSNELLGHAFITVSLTPPPANHQPFAFSIIPTLPTAKLGDIVTKDGYSIAAIAVNDPAQPVAGFKTKRGVKIVAVELIINNTSGAAPLELNPMNGYVVDDKGFVYNGWEGIGALEQDFPLYNLNIGGKAQGWMAFLIPQNAKPVYVKYETQGHSNIFLITGLTK